MLVGGVARDHSHDDLVTFGKGYVLEGEVVVGLNEGRGEYVFSAVAEHETEEAPSRSVEVASKYPSLVGGGVRGSKYCRVLMHDYLLWPDYYMDYERTKDTEWQIVDRTRMAEGKGFEPLDRVNGRRFSRPLHGFQARQNQTKRDQRRPIAAGLLGKGRFVWFCPYWSGLGSSVYQIRTTGWSSFWVGLDDACTTVQRRPASRTAISTAGLPGGPGPWPSPLQRPLHP